MAGEETSLPETGLPTATAVAHGTEVAEPTATPANANPRATEEAAIPPVDTTNPFPKILGPNRAREGWHVQPCEGNGPFLCVLKGAENIGFVHLSSYPLETMPDFRQMLSDAGVDADLFDHKNPRHVTQARQALMAFVENYHSLIMEDRKATFGSTKTYKRLETSEADVGELPGLRYGMAVLNQDGSIYERWLSYSTFDGEGLFTIVASFYPDRELSFRSDAELLQFEPFLVEIIKGLKLPHPEVRGDKIRG
ncbi:MAG: hypothetical protein M3319_12430 [Actinomycetota bacterium]|nr:hypothetical protein [Actinomycetota bacterium]